MLAAALSRSLANSIISCDGRLDIAVMYIEFSANRELVVKQRDLLKTDSD